MSAHPVSIVVALAENGVIGRDNGLAWRLRTDLRRFRALTIGKPIVMGRKTFASIGRPLPGRETVVVTRNAGLAQEVAAGVHVVHDFEDALTTAGRLADAMGADEIPVVGGAEIYRLALPVATRLHLTRVHASPEGDTVFPSFDEGAFRETFREPHEAGPEDEHPFTFIELERR